MNCSEFEARLSDYVDGDISPHLRKRFLQHKEYCPDCDKLLEDFKSALFAIHSLPRKKTSPDFNRRLYERINRLEEKSIWQKFLGIVPEHLFPRYAIAMAVATIALLIGLNTIQETGDSIAEPDQPVLPPPSLNVPQQVLISNQPGLLQTPITMESDTDDTNRIMPVQEGRSFEGQIRYVNGQ